MAGRPLVSVLLPVRDAERTLRECLGSLAAQSLADHEVVAVDDGSQDSSGRVLEETAREDPRVRVIHTPRRGLVSALNTAMREARGSLTARMDADDVAHRDRLAIQARRLETDAATAILGCRVAIAGDPGQDNRGMRTYVAWLNALLDHDAISRDIWVESPLAHPTVMMATGHLRGLGGYRDFGGPEDYDLWLRAHAAGLRFAKVPQVLLSWRDSPARLSRTDPRYGAARFLALKIEALERRLLTRDRAVVLWGAGPIGKAWARDLVRQGHRLAAFVEVAPRKIGRVVQGAPVVAVASARQWPGALHLAAVGQPGARERIRMAARRLGLTEGETFLAVA